MARKTVLVESGGGLPVAPLIDVVLLLLIFFMLVSKYLPPSLSVTLPEASAGQPVDRPSVSLSIDNQGRLSVDGTLRTWNDLPALLDNRDPDTLVRIAADKQADYDYVVKALDASALAGLNSIALEITPQ